MVDELIGTLIADKYRVERLIRESATGDLFTARHDIKDTPVTLKVLPMAVGVDARWTKRFIDESRAVSALTHPNVLAVSDFGTDQKNVSYAAYEPVDGKTLKDELTESGIDQDKAIAFAQQIANAVSAAHEKKIVHGRLAPENIFVEENEAVKVYGFGGDPAYVPRDADPRYLSPEQLDAAPLADERSDVYSLGVMLYEMLAGVVPFDGKKPSDILAKIQAEPPPPLSAFRRDLHPEIEPMILTALAVDPEKRYQTISAFAEDLALVAGVPLKTEAAAASGKQRNVWKTAAFALGGILVLAIALIYATSVRKTDPTNNLQADAGSLPVQPIGPATGAQEENLSKMPDLTMEEVMAMQQGTMEIPPGTLPGGDGYNAWASGAPPLGAPAPSTGAPGQFVQPGGQTVTIDPNNGSQFMPQQEGTVILVPVPQSNSETVVKPTPTPKNPAANTAPTNTTKPLVTPTPKPAKPATEQPAKKPGTKPGDPEL